MPMTDAHKLCLHVYIVKIYPCGCNFRRRIYLKFVYNIISLSVPSSVSRKLHVF